MATEVGLSDAKQGPNNGAKRVVLHVPASMTEMVQTSTPSAGSEVSTATAFGGEAQSTPISTAFSTQDSIPLVSPLQPVRPSVNSSPFVPMAHSSAPANDGIVWGQRVKEGPLKWRNSSDKLIDVWAVCKDWALEIFPSRDKTSEQDRLCQVNLINTRSRSVKIDPYRESKEKVLHLCQPALRQPNDPRPVLNSNTRLNTFDTPFVVRALPSIQACSTNVAPPSLAAPASLSSPASSFLSPSKQKTITELVDKLQTDEGSANAGILPLVVEELADDAFAPLPTAKILPATYLTGRPSTLAPTSNEALPVRSHRGTVAMAHNAVVESVAAAAASTMESGRNSASLTLTNLIMEANPQVDVFTTHSSALGTVDEVDPKTKLAFFIVLCTQGKRGLHTFAAETPAERASWLFVLHRLRRFDSGGLPPFLSLTGDEWVNTDLNIYTNAPGAGARPSYLLGSVDHNTKKSGFLKSAVSKKKRRFCLDGFDLDLTYITGRIIAMGFPSVGREAIYRNAKEDVIRFFESRHKGHYKVYNLCSERPYNKDIFPELLHFPFDDHNPPSFEDILFCIRDLITWLQAHPENIACIHCKAGKGRTGLIIVALLLYIGMWESADEALSYYAFVRTKNQKGVTIPSQIRYIYMFEAYLKLSRNRLRELRSIHNRVVESVSTISDSTSASTTDEPDGSAVVTQQGENKSTATLPTSDDLRPLLPNIQLPFRLPPAEAFELAAQSASNMRSLSSNAAKLSNSPTTYSEAVSLFSASPANESLVGLESPSQGNAMDGNAQDESKVDIVRNSNGSIEVAGGDDDFLEIPNQPVKELKISTNSPFYEALSTNDTFIGLPDRHTKYLTQIVISSTAPSHDYFIVICDGCVLSSTQLPITHIKNNKPSNVPEGRCKKTKQDDGQIVYEIPIGLIPVEGDFYVEFHKKKFFGRISKPFSFWLHTQFTSFVDECVTMNRQQLDKAAKKKKGTPFTVTVKLHDPMPHIKPLQITPYTVSQTTITNAAEQPEEEEKHSDPLSSTLSEINLVSSSPANIAAQIDSQPASAEVTTTPAKHVVKLHVPSDF